MITPRLRASPVSIVPTRRYVANVTELDAALIAANDGDEIRLAPGNYEVANRLINQSWSPSNRVRLLGAPGHASRLYSDGSGTAGEVKLNNFSGAILDGLYIDTSNGPLRNYNGSTDNDIVNCLFSAENNWGDGSSPQSNAIQLSPATNYRIQGNRFHKVGSGVSLTTIANCSVVENIFYRTQIDCIFINGNVDGFTAARNVATGWEGAVVTGFHSDFLQASTLNVNATTPLFRNITVVDNLVGAQLLNTASYAVQGFLWEDERATQAPGVYIPLENVVFSRNLIVEGGSWGMCLSFSFIDGLEVTDNIFLCARYPADTGHKITLRHSDSASPPSADSDNLLITGNICSGVQLLDGHEVTAGKNKTIENNTDALLSTPTWKASSYLDYFRDANDPSSDFITGFLPRVGGPLDSPSANGTIVFGNMSRDAINPVVDTHAGTGQSDIVDITIETDNASLLPTGTVSYQIDWGDGNVTAAASGSHQYATGGQKTIWCTVTGDNKSLSVPRHPWVRKPIILDLRFSGGVITDAAPREGGSYAQSAPVWYKWPAGTSTPDASGAIYGSDSGIDWVEFNPTSASFLQCTMNSRYWGDTQELTFITQLYPITLTQWLIYASYLMNLTLGATANWSVYTEDAAGTASDYGPVVGALTAGSWNTILAQFDGRDPSGPSWTVTVNGGAPSVVRNAAMLAGLRRGGGAFRIGCGYDQPKMCNARLGRLAIINGLVADFPA